MHVYVFTYKASGKQLACLSDEDLTTDIASKLRHHLPVTLCTKGTHVLVRHARHTVEKKITYLDRAEMS